MPSYFGIVFRVSPYLAFLRDCVMIFFTFHLCNALSIPIYFYYMHGLYVHNSILSSRVSIPPQNWHKLFTVPAILFSNNLHVVAMVSLNYRNKTCFSSELIKFEFRFFPADIPGSVRVFLTILATIFCLSNRKVYILLHGKSIPRIAMSNPVRINSRVLRVNNYVTMFLHYHKTIPLTRLVTLLDVFDEQGFHLTFGVNKS